MLGVNWPTLVILENPDHGFDTSLSNMSVQVMTKKRRNQRVIGFRRISFLSQGDLDFEDCARLRCAVWCPKDVTNWSGSGKSTTKLLMRYAKCVWLRVAGLDLARSSSSGSSSSTDEAVEEEA